MNVQKPLFNMLLPYPLEWETHAPIATLIDKLNPFEVRKTDFESIRQLLAKWREVRITGFDGKGYEGFLTPQGGLTKFVA